MEISNFFNLINTLCSAIVSVKHDLKNEWVELNHMLLTFTQKARCLFCIFDNIHSLSVRKNRAV